MEVKTPSNREGKDLAGTAKTDNSRENNLPNIQFRELGGSETIQTKLFSFQKILFTDQERKQILFKSSFDIYIDCGYPKIVNYIFLGSP